jgi:hypothetical protein
VELEKQIKCRAEELGFTQPMEKQDPYRTSGILSDNRVNATTGIKCDGRHNDFATLKGLPEKSGRTNLPQLILMTRGKRRKSKIEIRA